MYTVYALVDPRDSQPHYVGITDNLYERFIQHLHCDGSNTRKDAWIQSLKDANVVVRMDALQTVASKVEVHVREAYWIHHFLQLGIELYNNTIPTPLNLRGKKAQDFTLRALRDSHIASIIALSSNTDGAVNDLHSQGWGKQAIIEHLWNVKKGGSPRYKQAEAEYEAILQRKEA